MQTNGLVRQLVDRGRALTAVLVWTGACAAQDSSFEPKPSAATGLNGLTSVEIVDVDGDGDMDFLAATGSTGQILWVESDGNANPQFPLTHVITNSIANAQQATAADIDGDGDMDVLAGVSTTNGQVLWYRNDGGLPSSFIPVVLGSLSAGDIGARVNAAQAADIDGDGDTDVVVSFFVNQLQNQGHVVWFESNGAPSPTFTANPLPASTGTLENVLDIQIADLNGNGSLDIAAVSETPGTPGGRNRVVWWSNDGSPNPSFQFQTIDSNLVDPISIAIADIGGNAAPDIAVTAAGSGLVSVFLSSGTPAPVFTNAVNLNIGDPREVEAVDIDGDGDQDLLVAVGTGLDAVIFESDGNTIPGFSPRTLGTFPAFCDALAVGDIDGNGKLDVAAAFPGAGRLDWFAHVTPIFNTVSGSEHATFDEAIAFAGNGDTLVVAEDRLMRDPFIDFAGKALEVQSDGSFVLGDQSFIELADGAVLSGQPGADVHLDGDLLIPGNSTAWVFADNGAVLGTSLDLPPGGELKVTTDLSVQGKRRFSRTVVDADSTVGSFQNLVGRPISSMPINVAGSEVTGFVVVGDEPGGPSSDHSAGVAVYAPDSLSSTGWSGYAVDNSVDAIHCPLAVGDFNGDGLDDIATIREMGGSFDLRIHTAQVDVIPTYVSVTGASGQGAQHLVPSDLDFDGDLDLVTGQGWFRNSGAAVPSFTFVPFPFVSGLESFGVVVADFDLDGGRDVAIHCEKTDLGVPGRVGYQLYVLTSDADPSPSFTPVLIQERDYVASGDCTGDFDCYPIANVELKGLNTLSREDQDKDGLTDFFMSEDDGITLFMNISSAFPQFASTSIDSGSVFCSVVPVDADGDRDIDLLAASQRQSRVVLLENAVGTNYRQGLAVRPTTRASSVALLGTDGGGLTRLAVVASGHDRIGVIDYGLRPGVTLDNSAQLDVSGSLVLSNATLSLADAQILTNGQLVISPTGVLEGKGGVLANVQNTGIVRPYESLMIGGTFTQRSPFFPGESGAVEVSLRTTQDVDQLNVSGGVSLLGGLIARATPNFVPSVGTPIIVVTAGDIDDALPMFDVVHAPKVTVLDQGDPFQGSLMPGYTDQPGASSVDLNPTVIEDPVLGRSDFAAIATPSDAVVYDITGGPDGLPDGYADTVVAYPRLPNGVDQGGLAVFLGVPGSKTRFDFESLSLYSGPVVNQPVAVEAADFDGDGAIEIAMGNSLNFNQSDVFLLEADSSMQVPIFEASAPPLLLRKGAKILDMARSDYMPGLQRGRGLGFMTSPIGLVVLTDAEDSGVATAAILSGPSWDGCDIDVCDDPDSVDPIDTDGVAGAVLIEGYCATSNDDNKVVVASNPAADPGNFEVNSFDVGDGPTEIRADDIDDDGYPDIVTINETAGTVSVLLNIVDGSGPGGRGFDAHIELPLQLDPADPDPLPSSVALADLDDDGDLDIAVVSTNASDERVVRELKNLYVETGTVSFAAVEDLADQPTGGIPVLVREADLEGDSGAEMLNDDLVVFVEPGIGSLRLPELLGFSQHMSLTSGVGPVCLADVNGDGMLTAADFTAWIIAFNTMAPECDQNSDGLCTPTDFTAWISNYNAGCP